MSLNSDINTFDADGGKKVPDFQMLQKTWAALYPVVDELRFIRDLIAQSKDVDPTALSSANSALETAIELRKMIGKHIGEDHG